MDLKNQIKTELKGTLWCGTMKQRENPEDGYIMLIGTQDIYDVLKPYFAKEIKITISEPDEVIVVLKKEDIYSTRGFIDTVHSGRLASSLRIKVDAAYIQDQLKAALEEKLKKEP